MIHLNELMKMVFEEMNGDVALGLMDVLCASVTSLLVVRFEDVASKMLNAALILLLTICKMHRTCLAFDGINRLALDMSQEQQMDYWLLLIDHNQQWLLHKH